MLVLLASAFPAYAQWVSEGIPASITTDDQRYVEAVEDGSGGIIMVWDVGRGTPADIYAQRIGAYGYPVWDPDGVAICTVGGTQQYPVVCSDGAGGAVIAWEDNRAMNWDIYGMRMNEYGVKSWVAGGLYLTNVSGDQIKPCIIEDGEGYAIVAWQGRRSGAAIRRMPVASFTARS